MTERRAFYHEGMRALQDRFDGRRVADRLAARGGTIAGGVDDGWVSLEFHADGQPVFIHGGNLRQFRGNRRFLLHDGGQDQRLPG